jgi:hypothetical protein
VGSGGFGFTDELPQPDFAGRVRCKDLWGFTESQETVSVSPRMYREFIFPYEKPIMDRFGLNCYGCCEPLNQRWSTVKEHPRLRRVSCSPWADLAKMAEYLGGEYILSLKPNPAAIASAEIDEDAIRQGLRKAIQQTRGCRVEIIMKDNHTIGKRPRTSPVGAKSPKRRSTHETRFGFLQHAELGARPAGRARPGPRAGIAGRALRA